MFCDPIRRHNTTRDIGPIFSFLCPCDLEWRPRSEMPFPGPMKQGRMRHSKSSSITIALSVFEIMSLLNQFKRHQRSLLSGHERSRVSIKHLANSNSWPHTIAEKRLEGKFVRGNKVFLHFSLMLLLDCFLHPVFLLLHCPLFSHQQCKVEQNPLLSFQKKGERVLSWLPWQSIFHTLLDKIFETILKILPIHNLEETLFKGSLFTSHFLCSQYCRV